jgi:molybdenum cofactor sulfurtransferase
MSSAIDNRGIEEYTKHIEELRLNTDEFKHIGDEVFLDNAANGIYTKSLVKEYYEKLTNASMFSNPHSHSQSGQYTNLLVDETRHKILKLFNSNISEYDVVFVMNVTQGLKLLAESFEFTAHPQVHDEKESKQRGCFCYLNDNHTSVVGMREVVWQHADADVYCLAENEKNLFEAKLVMPPLNWKYLESYSPSKVRNLLVFPAQSNFNGRKYDPSLIDSIKQIEFNKKPHPNDIETEWFVCLDTASLVCTSPMDLKSHKPDFMLVSFYKIFGFPTGIAALLVRKTHQVREGLCNKRYFGGGTVSLAMIDEYKVFFKNCSIQQNRNVPKSFQFHEFFEDGTISYLDIIGVGLAIDNFSRITLNRGLRLIQAYTEPLSNQCLTEMLALEHYNGTKLVEVYRKTQHEHGPIIAFNLKNSRQKYIGFNLVDKLAQENKIHLRTGCFCNIGACQMHLAHLKESFLENFVHHGHKCGDHIDLINGLPTGAIRISFGYSTIQQDIRRFIRFLADYFIDTKEEKLNETKHSVNSSKSKEDLMYYQLTHIFLYPIKSCAPMKVETSWPVTSTGLEFDRNWLIVDHNNIPLNQKRFPQLTKLIPTILLDENILKLTYEDETFELDLSTRGDRVESSNVGYDQGDRVAQWLQKVFKIQEKCRLLRAMDQSDSSFVNKSNYLLINAGSIRKLRNYLLELEENHDADLNKDPRKLKEIDEFLILQFRANLVLSPLHEEQSDTTQVTDFVEEQWKHMTTISSSLQFKVLESCTRCQMININQLDSNKQMSQFCSMLLKKIHKLKSNSKFGVYLTQIDEKTSHEKVLDFLLSRKLNKLSLGDIFIVNN